MFIFVYFLYKLNDCGYIIKVFGYTIITYIVVILFILSPEIIQIIPKHICRI